MSHLVRALPKAELHLHIEGTLQPQLAFALAAKHGVNLQYQSVEDLARAYDFADLQAFLDLYYAGMDVLRDEEDFYTLTKAYLDICRAQNTIYVEVGFDPQGHTERGVPFEVPYRGIQQALDDARRDWGLQSGLILNLLRHLPEENGLAAIASAEACRADILALGLDSSEAPFPPAGFSRAFAKARSLGWHTVAHAGEEGPPAYIWSALNDLRVERIDHGVRCSEDPVLVRHLVEQQIPLTVCPLSNVRLKVFEALAQHNVLELLEQGVMVTVNSDDPAYFGGYLEENFSGLSRDLGMSDAQLVRLAKNSFRASFASDTFIRQQIEQIDIISRSSER